MLSRRNSVVGFPSIHNQKYAIEVMYKLSLLTVLSLLSFLSIMSSSSVLHVSSFLIFFSTSTLILSELFSLLSLLAFFSPFSLIVFFRSPIWASSILFPSLLFPCSLASPSRPPFFSISLLFISYSLCLTSPLPPCLLSRPFDRKQKQSWEARIIRVRIWLMHLEREDTQAGSYEKNMMVGVVAPTMTLLVQIVITIFANTVSSSLSLLRFISFVLMSSSSTLHIPLPPFWFCPWDFPSCFFCYLPSYLFFLFHLRCI